MKTKICYEVKDLMPKLAKFGYSFGKLPISEEDEEWPSHDSTAYYFFQPEVKKIEYFYGFGTTARIELADGRRIRGFAKNISSNEEYVYLHDNEYVSPRLNVSDSLVEATDDLIAWLLKHGVEMSDLDKCKKEFNIYETIEFCGVPTPLKQHGYWAYSSETLVMDEKEISEILDDIEDELLREKTKCILYSRVFKRHR